MTIAKRLIGHARRGAEAQETQRLCKARHISVRAVCRLRPWSQRSVSFAHFLRESPPYPFLFHSRLAYQMVSPDGDAPRQHNHCPPLVDESSTPVFRSSHVAVPRADRLHRLRLPGAAVRHCLLWRSPQDAAIAAHARLGVQPVFGGLLHQLDILRRGGPVHRAAVGLPAHLPGTDPAADVRALGGAEDGDDFQAGEHHLDRRLHCGPLRQVADAGHRHCADLSGGRAALPGPAAQGHRAGLRPADRRQPHRV